MDETKNSSFVGLEAHESLTRLSAAFSSKTKIKVWKKGESFKEVSFLDVKAKSQQFSIRESFPVGTTLYFSFQLANGSFFGKGLVKLLRAEGEVVVEIVDKIFKYEKRKDERLLTYPHQQVFIFFELASTHNMENVVSINRPSGTKIDMFKKFEKSLHADDSFGERKEGLIGFRVLDLSLGGVSFVTNNLEKDFFKVGEKYSECIIDFNGKKVFLEKGEVLHSVNYMDPKARNVSLFKIGYKFDLHNLVLTNLISKFTGPVTEEDLVSDFEVFFENHE